jgi:hypothetical protein
MVEYLSRHFRYDVMNSCNNATSYARCIKLRNLSFSSTDAEDNAYAVIASDTDWWQESGIHEEIDAFGQRHGWCWQIGANGRSGGYLVLYQGYREPSGYKSYCVRCGQLNYTVSTSDKNHCGKCGAATRVNFHETHMKVGCWPGRGTDDHVDISGWSRDELARRVAVVRDFDQTVDRCIQRFMDYCETHKIVEKTIMVAKQVHVCVRTDEEDEDG